MKLFNFLLLLHFFFIVAYSTGFNSPSHLQHDNLDIDALLAVPIEPGFKDCFHPPCSPTKDDSEVTSNPKEPIKSWLKMPTVKKVFKHIGDERLRKKEMRKGYWEKHAEKYKEIYGETHKHRAIRKHLIQLSEEGKTSKEQEEQLSKLNERHETELAKKT